MHTFIDNKNFFRIYLLSWLLIAGAHFALLFFVLNTSLQYAIIDSLVYNILFAATGLSIGFISKYTGKDKRFRLIFVNHALAMIILLAVWLLISYFILNIIAATTKLEMPYEHKTWYPFRIMAGVLFYSVIALINYLILYVEKVNEEMLIREKMENTLKETRLRALKSQINPHFLFNSLNSISYLVGKEPDKAKNMISVLSEYFRYSIKSKDTSTKLSVELDNCKKYLEIEKVRFGNRLVIEDNINPKCLDYMVPSMILQPIYENAIKHGVYESIEPVVLQTFVQNHSDYILVSIINDFDEESVSRKGEGLGLKNVSDRLSLMYNKEGLLNFEKSNNKFTVKIVIPKI
jgi:two-component system, LytTR family, sensor kinase